MAFFKENPPKKREGVRYIPQLYIKNTEWVQRLTANKEIEQELDNFELKLRQAWRNHQKRLSISNLTIRQWQLAEQLLRSDSHIVVEADKNLGGCIMDRELYITKGICEHLGNENVYKKLTKTEANQKMHIVRYKINLFLSCGGAIAPVVICISSGQSSYLIKCWASKYVLVDGLDAMRTSEASMNLAPFRSN